MADRHITRKVVINTCYGGFGLSEEARARYKELSGTPVPRWLGFGSRRFDPVLVRVVEELGSERASDKYARLKVVAVCAMHLQDYKFSEYDGLEGLHVASGCQSCRNPDVFPTRRSTIRVRHFSV